VRGAIGVSASGTTNGERKRDATDGSVSGTRTANAVTREYASLERSEHLGGGEPDRGLMGPPFLTNRQFDLLPAVALPASRPQ
jgi:hypothetical protein